MTRPCRPQRHAWRFAEALPMLLFSDGRSHVLTLHTCGLCGACLELGGDFDYHTRTITHPHAAIWGPQAGVTPVPLG